MNEQLVTTYTEACKKLNELYMGTNEPLRSQLRELHMYAINQLSKALFNITTNCRNQYINEYKRNYMRWKLDLEKAIFEIKDVQELWRKGGSPSLNAQGETIVNSAADARSSVALYNEILTEMNDIMRIINTMRAKVVLGEEIREN